MGDEVGAAAKEKDRPVVEVPNVRGRAVVWRVSFGREVIVVVASGDRHDMVEKYKVKKEFERSNVVSLIKEKERKEEEEGICFSGVELRIERRRRRLALGC